MMDPGVYKGAAYEVIWEMSDWHDNGHAVHPSYLQQGLFRGMIMVLVKRCLLLSLLVLCSTVQAEDGYEAWLRYHPLGNKGLLESYRGRTACVVLADESPTLRAAAEELTRGLSGLLGYTVEVTPRVSEEGAVVLQTTNGTGMPADLQGSLDKTTNDGYVLASRVEQGKQVTVIASKTDAGVLYGAFHFLRLIQTGQGIDALHIVESPSNPLRLLNHWDNPSGSVERGYAGRSIFHWDELPKLRPRYIDYARLLASIGINGCVVNNVNTTQGSVPGWKLITHPYLEKAAPLADLLGQYGIRYFVSVNFASPILTGDLDTADPLDPEVQKWWKDRARDIYKMIPNFGGFLVKADSEGQPGPFTYGRNHAQGANMLARALADHGGLVIWRAFVYGHKNMDRAMQAYASFKPHDGEFDANVIIQVKNGPMDFQVREPVSPLFGQMPKTNLMLELQITQEYTGFSTDLCYLVPQWKDCLSFDTYAKGKGSTLDKVVDGSLHAYAHCGMAGVANIGGDRNWTGHHLAQANTYGFGRLAWNPTESAQAITRDWVKMTFSQDKEVVDTLSEMLLASYQTFEDYSSPLGVGFMCDFGHYNPAPASRQKGYHHADKNGVGYDRTLATGSGFTGQYHEPVAQIFESLKTCPEALLLFFHHVPYTHRLSSGKTVIQQIYDTHNEGVRQVETLRGSWQSLQGKIDKERYDHVLNKFNEQIKHACLWRDAINGYFKDTSGIQDKNTNTP
jgi:alpha-glucuronidase